MRGRVGCAANLNDLSPPVPLPVENGRALPAHVVVKRHRVGRLTARVVIRAGAEVKEHLAESEVFDLSTGTALGSELIRALDSLDDVAGDPSAGWHRLVLAPMRPAAELVQLMLSSLEQQLRPAIDDLGMRSQNALRHELGRIERYYTTLLDDAGSRGTQVPDNATRRAIEAEHQRRAREETERHQVRATVHPVQLAEWEVAVQRADWAIESTTGHRGSFTAQRMLAGSEAWTVSCPTCGAAPSALLVCLHDHVACPNCSRTCSVCADACCREHGISSCHVDNAPACSAHARSCLCCGQRHCSRHEGVCDESGHAACSACLSPCAHCARVICDQHATLSHPDAPRGSRRLCGDCVRTCEGGRNEVVGPDEVTGCASCRRDVCERHQSHCDVDNMVHCSRHLRRTDRSRRLTCEKHRGACVHEPNAVLASDEVSGCVTCANNVCVAHSASCIVDNAVHCHHHLAPVRDVRGALACEPHRSVCHVDGGVFTLQGTEACPSCGRLHCKDHRRECANCGRGICIADYRPGAPVCATCSRLVEVDDLPNAILAAISHTIGDRASKVKRWRAARDARHAIVELGLRWTRRIVLAVPHGGGRPEAIVSHSILGRRVRRG